MKTTPGLSIVAAVLISSLAATIAFAADGPKMKMTTDIPPEITTPDSVETSIGTLNFFDGAPDQETAEKVYDYLDTMRGVDVFLKGMPLASLAAMIDGLHELGAIEAHQVVFTDKLLDSTPLFLTGNTSTLYVSVDLDLKRDGPTVIEAPAGMLGAINDAAFHYVEDIGPVGPDKGKGGKYLILPPGYEGDIPDGYFIVKTKTYRIWIFLRASIANGVEAAAKHVKEGLRIYPLSKQDNPPPMEFITGSGKSFNTIHPNNFEFYGHLNEVIQYEPLEMIDPETRGLFAAIGIEKGKEFAPDPRMKRILSDAVAIANAASRSIVWYPRTDGTMTGIRIYPDTDSAWIMAYLGKNVFFNGEDGQTMNSDARVMFHYPYTGVTPAMAISVPGVGSDYGMAFVDSNKKAFDGSRTYRLHIPADAPAKDFWAVTIYDSQTRSLLQTSQKFPTVGSQTEGIKKNANGSYDLYFGPKAPRGYENNWLETVPAKSWFVILRIYGPLEPWIEKTWRPGEVELVK
jgi:hypothetical protein